MSTVAQAIEDAKKMSGPRAYLQGYLDALEKFSGFVREDSQKWTELLEHQVAVIQAVVDQY